MITFNGSEELKKELLEKLKHHQELDTFIQGTWIDEKSGKVEGNGFRGCFYGCTMQTKYSPLEKFSEYYSIDLWFCAITERIFEGLSLEEAKLFPLQCIEALSVGLDMDTIKSDWNRIVLTDQLRFVKEGSEQYAAIEKCIELFSLPFNQIERSAARSVELAAESAAWSAAWSAARSAELAARSAARSAELAARSAADSAAWSADSAARSADSAARSAVELAESAEKEAELNYYLFLRDTFIKLLKQKIMNLFNFEYETAKILNKDNTESRFGIVYGEGGNVIHTKKDSYSIIKSYDISELGMRFREEGYVVSSFTHKHGEVIGLNISLGDRPTKVGDKTYNAIITVPNNGGGKGYMSINEVRLVCLNGMTRMVKGAQSIIKIPHTIDYNWSIETMQKSLQSFVLLLESIEASDVKMDDHKLERADALYHLNKWFFEYEFPVSQKPKGYSFEAFRQDLYSNTEDIKCYNRYLELLAAFDKEVGYNGDLGLTLSMYTVYASVTNYLSRRVEVSASAAPVEIQFERVSSKMEYFSY